MMAALPAGCSQTANIFPEKKPMPGWALPGWPGFRNKSGFFQHLCFLPYTFPLCYGILFVKADKIIDAETSRQVTEWIRMTKAGRLYEQEKIEYANKQRENDIIYLGREDGKSEEEIVSRLKKMLGYDDSEARAAISVFDSRQAAGV